MNAKQKEKLITAVKEDCELRFTYYCNGKTCVIGKLAKLSKYPLKNLQKKHAETFVSQIQPLVDRIELTFGINIDQQLKMQKINDHEEHRENRINAILRYIEEIPVVE